MSIKEDNKKIDEKIDEMIGKCLRHYRLQHGSSQQDLGTFLDLTFQQIQKYERGINRVSISTLVQICRYLKVSPLSFLKDALEVDNNVPLSGNRSSALHIKTSRIKNKSSRKILNQFLTYLIKLEE